MVNTADKNVKDRNGNVCYTLPQPKIRSKNGVLTPEWIEYGINFKWSDEEIEREKRLVKQQDSEQWKFCRPKVSDTYRDQWEEHEIEEEA